MLLSCILWLAELLMLVSYFSGDKECEKLKKLTFRAFRQVCDSPVIKLWPRCDHVVYTIQQCKAFQDQLIVSLKILDFVMAHVEALDPKDSHVSCSMSYME